MERFTLYESQTLDPMLPLVPFKSRSGDKNAD
jgi:hypothetical protein